MISSGMSILRALYVLEEQTESKFLKETIVAVRKDVEAGLSLSDAMARHPKVFNPLFVAMTQAGETGGVLEDALHARRRPAAEGRLAAPTDQIGDGLPDARDHLRRRRDDGARRLPGARVRGRLQAVRRRTARRSRRSRCSLSQVVTGYWWAMFGVARPSSSFTFVKWKKARVGAQAVGPLPPARADEDRHDRPAGRGRALVAHAGLADERRRAAAAGARDHRHAPAATSPSRRRWTA